MINVKVDIQGLRSLQAQLQGQGKQVRYAASRALNSAAFAVNAKLKDEMRATFKGGASPWTLRAFRVEKATRENLAAIVALRNDGADGGTPYSQALAHLFTGGQRRFKKVEGLLRDMGLLPDGLIVVPGAACRLDARGNILRSQWTEMIGALRSSIRNVRIHKGRTAKGAKQIGYFALAKPYRGLQPGIWRRIETRGSSVVHPMLLFVTPGQYRPHIRLDDVARPVIAKTFQPEFEKELSMALRNAR